MHQDLTFSNIVGVEISDFEVVDEDRDGQFFVPDLFDRGLESIFTASKLPFHHIELLKSILYPTFENAVPHNLMNIFPLIENHVYEHF